MTRQMAGVIDCLLSLYRCQLSVRILISNRGHDLTVPVTKERVSNEEKGRFHASWRLVPLVSSTICKKVRIRCEEAHQNSSTPCPCAFAYVENRNIGRRKRVLFVIIPIVIIASVSKRRPSNLSLRHPSHHLRDVDTNPLHLLWWLARHHSGLLLRRWPPRPVILYLLLLFHIRIPNAQPAFESRDHASRHTVEAIIPHFSLLPAFSKLTKGL